MATVNGCAHVLFTRVPRPGAVKTRLAPILSPEQRAALQEALIIDTTLKMASLDGSVALCYTDTLEAASDDPAFFDAFIGNVQSACDAAQPILTLRQKGDDLGTRMSNAFVDIFTEGANSCLLLGSDLPYITAADIAEAEKLLGQADVVLGPSPDGGYWLVGLNEPFPELFTCEHYGESDVLAHTVSICKRHGKTVAFAPHSSDVDVPGDYQLLSEFVNAGDTRIGPYTTRVVTALNACAAEARR